MSEQKHPLKTKWTGGDFISVALHSLKVRPKIEENETQELASNPENQKRIQNAMRDSTCASMDGNVGDIDEVHRIANGAGWAMVGEIIQEYIERREEQGK